MRSTKQNENNIEQVFSIRSTLTRHHKTPEQKTKQERQKEREREKEWK